MASKDARVAQRAPAARASFGNVTAFRSAALKAPVAERGALQISCASLADLRDRITSVGNTKKITDAMKLVAAAKVRRAQEAVIGGRPFSENLVKVLYAVNARLANEDVESPLASIRPVKTVLLVVCNGDRGLCGGFNTFIIRKADERKAELEALGIKVKLLCVGKKASKWFTGSARQGMYDVVGTNDMGNKPTIQEATVISDKVFADFVGEEVDKVEMIYTKFTSLIATAPVIQTLLPLTPKGEVCDINGNCVDAANDEVFMLTTKDGELTVERTASEPSTDAELEASILFEQDPAQILDALLPLYLNGQILRAFQESIASELASRMNAMNTASDNAKELKKNLSLVYNRSRQAKITAELIELCAGS